MRAIIALFVAVSSVLPLLVLLPPQRLLSFKLERESLLLGALLEFAAFVRVELLELLLELLLLTCLGIGGDHAHIGRHRVCRGGRRRSRQSF